MEVDSAHSHDVSYAWYLVPGTNLCPEMSGPSGSPLFIPKRCIHCGISGHSNGTRTPPVWKCCNLLDSYEVCGGGKAARERNVGKGVGFAELHITHPCCGARRDCWGRAKSLPPAFFLYMLLVTGTRF